MEVRRVQQGHPHHQEEEMNDPEHIVKVNLGCGNTIKEGWINLDQYPGPGVDMVFELGKGPLPFQDRSVDHILAQALFEHIYNWEQVLMECFRILKVGGTIEIIVPYKTVGFNSPYHVRYFSPRTMDLFLKDQHHSFSTKEPKAGGFIILKLRIRRVLPYAYWFKKTFGLWPPAIGRKDEIMWLLQKVE